MNRRSPDSDEVNPTRRNRKKTNLYDQDIFYEIRISLSDAYFGANVELDFFRFVECNFCGGTGFAYSASCNHCVPHGYVGCLRTEQTRTLKIPRGVDTGTRLRFRGAGNVGQKGELAGDLYVSINLSPHQVYKREGVDLFRELFVPSSVAAQGGEVSFAHLSGKRLRLLVPKGSERKQLRLRGEGMPTLNGNGAFGDLYVNLIS